MLTRDDPPCGRLDAYFRECYRSLRARRLSNVASLELKADCPLCCIALYFHRYYVPNMSRTVGRLANGSRRCIKVPVDVVPWTWRILTSILPGGTTAARARNIVTSRLRKSRESSPRENKAREYAENMSIRWALRAEREGRRENG
jgi:hypothetical protein